MGFETFNECASCCFPDHQSEYPLSTVISFHLWSCSNILRQMWVGMSPTGQRRYVPCTIWNIQKAFATILLLPCQWAQSSLDLLEYISYISSKSYVLLLTWVVPKLTTRVVSVAIANSLTSTLLSTVVQPVGFHTNMASSITLWMQYFLQAEVCRILQ